MQPTEHKHKNDEELITHIKQSLKTHEEFYKLGAWEKFNQQQTTKKPLVFWLVRMSGVAAILAICVSLIWFNQTNPEKEQLAQVKPLEMNEGTQNETEIEGKISNQTSAKEQLTAKVLSHKTSSAISQENTKESILTNERAGELPVQTTQNVSDVITKAAAVEAVTVEAPQTVAIVEDKTNKTDILDFLASETLKGNGKQDKYATNRKQKKWDMGLMLAPSFGNTRELNMGYGISMTYNFSNRLSLSSGIAYNKMNAGKNLPTNIGASSILLGNTKSLEMINEEVTGIDIPLELKYSINKNVYANFGVSGMAVLNQSRSNTFVEEVVIKSTASATSSRPSGSTGSIGGITPNVDALDAGSKGQFANAFIINQRTTERASAAAIEDVNYIGFYNFSFGYTKKVYKNHSIAIEPFVKLPIKVVTQDNLKLMGTGLRIRVGF